MCGILLTVSLVENGESVGEGNASDSNSHDENLCRRGPDHVKSVVVHCPKQLLRVELQASVLKMRSHSTLQPVAIPLAAKSQNEALHLAWNGEVYQRIPHDNNNDSNSDETMETVADYDVDDTQLVAECVRQLQAHSVLDASSSSPSTDSLQDYASLLAGVFGRLVNAEYAFCLLTPWAIYYARDPWGRRSLLLSSSTSQTNWKLASVKESDDNLTWTEVTPGILHEYRFQDGKFHTTPIVVQQTIPQQLLAIQETSIPEHLNVTPSMWKASLALEHYLREAVRLRVSGSSQNRPSVAVLFSGGVDSVVLAALTLQILPTDQPLRLWNVSFVNNKEQQQQATPSTAQDCRAALASYKELQQLFPHHTAVSLETTQVTWDEMTKWEPHVRTLIHPKTTLMDLNIAMALWFASRGGQHADSDDPKILLVGMGADEQLGGYGRHRKAFEQAMNQNNNPELAFASLLQELTLDMDRLWERNLGRDDRIFSDHGKEARFPYLDYSVMNFVKQTPLEDVCDFSLPPGQGDKRILRLVAMRLGLQTASGMVKRAIQFGSRIAHVSDKKRFGSRRKAQGTAVA
ncbi:Asparagine synthetase domain-containing protein 1 [Seminavis robusta]|uniref:Asparagine synthetase domain-containing protein 1 n=1 Tax=Seminavis robusta TaxID=568900 RepID=A0A9N8H8G3_9STRA|nr:Asparagine synthetase domain-containing protein 1 [Seminavis robusta]|eukprot:Sro91_g047590.1 Asparagine synthetase domain-containing protein 1 (575) ;mRNA; f:27508-29232